MTGFYKMDPADWDNGTANLTLEEEAAYLRIVNSMHKHKAPVPNNDRVLAGMFRVSMRKARALVASLVEAGKLSIEDGYISNERAASDLVRRGFVSISRAEMGSKGGRRRAENAAKALKNNDTVQAMASSREEKRREEDMSKLISPADKPPDKMRLPEDWALSDEGWAYARSQAIPDKVIEDEARGFHAYWTDRRDRDAKKSARGWEQCWANRVRSVAPRYAGQFSGRAVRSGMVDAFATVAAARSGRA